MKKPLVRTLLALCVTIPALIQAQTIYQLTPLPSFGSHGDGSLQPGDVSWLDNGFNQRGMAFDRVLTNLVLVDTHTGTGASADPKGSIYILNAQTGANLDDGFSGNFVLNTNGIPQVTPNQAYPYAPAVVTEDGVVYICNQVNDSSTTPFIIYRWDSTISTNPPLMVFSNTITPRQRYGTSIDVRGSGADTQIIIGSLASSSTGTNVVVFTTADGTNFTANVLGADVANPNFNDGVAFGAGNTFWAKQINQTLRCFAFNLAAHTATTIKSFDVTTFPDNPNLTAIAVNTNLNLLAALEQTGGDVAGGADRVRLYDISNFSNQPPALLDVKTFTPNNNNATAPMGYLDFVGTNLYAYVVNNGILAFKVGLGTPPAPTLTSVPPDTNQTVIGRTITLTVAGYPSVSYQWQSNGIPIPNATNGTLTLVNVQSNYAALYNCIVSNGGGSTNADSQLVVLSSASFYHLNLQWTAYPGDGQDSGGNHAYIFNGGGAAPGTPNVRSFAYNALSNHIYVMTRSGFGANATFSNYNFNVVDAATGNSLYTLKTNGIVLGIGNGGVGLASVAVADDGAIYACSMSPASGGFINGVFDDTRLFRIYRWANADSNTLPVQIYSGDPAINGGISGGTSTNRWGDTMAIRGSGTNTLILLDNNDNPPKARYVAIIYPTDNTMTNWTQSALHQLSTGTTIGRSLEFGAGGSARSGTFWQKRRATALIQSSFDLDNPIDPVPAVITTTAFTNSTSGGTVDAGRKLFMGVSTYATSPTPDTLDVYEVSDFTSPLLLAQYNFPVNSGTNHNANNANAINQTIRSGDKLFTLNTGNGLMAFNIVPGPPSAPQFLTQPSNLRLIQGGSGSFVVAADQQATFQWQFAGANISGATGLSYTVTNAQLTNVGQYRVVASNIFGISTSAVANLTVYLPQDEYSLSPIWNIAPGSGPGTVINSTGAGGGSPNQRTIAYNSLSNHLYVVSRSSGSTSNYVIYVLNASDGTVVSTLNTNGIYNAGAVGEGGIGLVGIGVADDGAIYACNEAPDACGCGPSTLTNTPADSLFRIYRWANGDSNTLPVQVFSGDPAGLTAPARWGDNLVVRGSGTNTEILLDNNQANLGAVLKPTDEFMTNFVSTSFGRPALGTSIGRSLQFGSSNTLWQKRSGTALQLSSYNLTNQTSATVANYSGFASTVGPALVDSARQIVVAVDFKGVTGTSPDAVNLYDFSVPTSPLLIAQYNFPTNKQDNGNFIGQSVFAGNRVWSLNANNGLIAFTLKGPELSLAQSGNNAVLSWSTNVAGLTLESTPSLSPPVVWTSLGSGTAVGARYYVTNAPGGLKFYRLKR